MKEDLLQFIWRSQYFNHHELLSETGEPICILFPGVLNTHQGPDFREAQVRIGNTLLAGSVELHVLASDWSRHAHDHDPHYRQVILHVVWRNDLTAIPKAAKGPSKVAKGPSLVDNIPILTLQHRVPKLLLGQYEQWMKTPAFIPCGSMAARVEEPVWTGWQRELLVRRLRRRTTHIESCLQQNQQDWEETTWWLMARNFGLPLNATAFETMGKSLPIRLLARHQGEPFQLEALLLGQAGLLEKEFQSSYPRSLQKEYQYLRKKYRLHPIHTPLSFLRMRPAHFPTLRLAQLAALLAGHTAWFAALRTAHSPAELEAWCHPEAGDYWKDHYILDTGSSEAQTPAPDKTLRVERTSPPEKDPLVPSSRPKRPGAMMTGSLLINTFVPLLYAYGCLRKEPHCRDKALRWLQGSEPEKNTILTGWERLGITNKNAVDSQALLELKTRYCDHKRCLECKVGQALLGKATVPPSPA